MSATNILLVCGSVLSACLFFHPKLLKSQLWRATVTPLASIIGSGFLVAGPILAHAAGAKAWLAMAGLCVIAYLFGAAIRHNIAHVEGRAAGGGHRIFWLERVSSLALSFAYFISVAYYLNLFAAFGLRFVDIVDPFWIRVAATAVIATIGVVGLAGGLGALERLEVGAVGLKLSVIGGLMLALLLATGLAYFSGDLAWRAPAHPHGLAELQVLLGLVILVQGFETSRYLGEEYDAKVRIKTMRLAQLFSSFIYVAFILLITGYFKNGLPEEGGETAIIDMLAPIGPALAPMIILVALASQLSAAVADTNGAGGLLAETSKGRAPVKLGNIATAAAAIAVTWTANIYEIIAYASRVFVLYYALQSAIAAVSAYRLGRPWLMALFVFATLLAVAIMIFAKPASV